MLIVCSEEKMQSNSGECMLGSEWLTLLAIHAVLQWIVKVGSSGNASLPWMLQNVYPYNNPQAT
jgi:hypothetical protein